MAIQQLYKRQKINEIKQICGKDNQADVMIKPSLNTSLKGLILINKVTI